MRVWGQLQKACLELLSSDPDQGVMGRLWFNTTSKEIKYDDGLVVRTLSSLGNNSGGGTLEWYPGGNSPVDTLDSVFNRVYVFAQGQLQQLFTSIKVPSGFVPGRQIKLVLQGYSSETSASGVLLVGQATLIRPNVDSFNSNTNQYNSTETSVALSSSTTNLPLRIEIDLTDSVGVINSLEVQPDDILRIKLFRQNSAGAPQVEVFTDSVADLYVLASMELVF